MVKDSNRLVTTVNRESASISCDMDAFPEFMKHPANRIAHSNQAKLPEQGKPENILRQNSARPHDQEKISFQP